VARYLLFASERYAFAIMRPLQDAIRARGDEAAWFFEHERLESSREPQETRLRSVQDVLNWRPDAVFVPGNWVPDFFPGLKVEVFHGFSVGKRSEARGHFRIRGSFDLYCTQGPDTTLPFADLQQRMGFFRVAETGWPKLDPLFSGVYPPVTNTRPVILFASTFTEDITCARILHATIANNAQQGDWQWLVTLHPKMATDVFAMYQSLVGPNLQFLPQADILQLYTQADVLLSDTSSVVPEFLLQHKPVVTFRNRQPGPYLLDVQQPDQVIPALQRALTRSSELMRAIEDYAQRIHPYRDGKSSERVLLATDNAIGNAGVGLKKKPLNLLRRLQARRRLGYWGPGY
jgi:CDP-glycerol glycerophosphotransferase (TagB/SpsB family)